MGKGAPKPQQQGGQQGPCSWSFSPKKLQPQFVGVGNDHSMVLVRNVLSPQESQWLIDAAEALGFEHQGSRGPAFGEAFRCV
jgi:hypothetical protein